MSSAKSDLEFLQEKWLVWFHAIDVNKDGVVSRADQDDCLDNIVKLQRNRIDKPSLDYLKEVYSDFWNKFIFGKVAHKNAITADEFVASLTEEFKENPEELKTDTRERMSKLVDVADFHSQTHISFPDFVCLYSAFGHTDKALLRLIFDAHNPDGNGEIVKVDFVDNLVDMVVGDDQSRENAPLSIFVKAAASSQKS